MAFPSDLSGRWDIASRGTLRNLTWLALSLPVICSNAPRAVGNEWVLQMQHSGEPLEGKAIHWTRNEFFLLGRDGRLWEFDISLAPQATMVSQHYRPFSAAELRTALLREYGPHYDVSGTGHYLVVHPLGQRDVWADRFEMLYREAIHYFAARGCSTVSPEQPLVAVVFPSEQIFQQHAAVDGVTSPGVLGYYHRRTNRILLFDRTAGQAGVDWRENLATIVHEAAHQTAFNVGVHNRWSNPPRWLTEGMGTMFEARGVHESSRYPHLSDRVNRDQLAAYRRYFPAGIRSDIIQAVVATDRLFELQPLPAYAVSWALTFMLAEQEPGRLAQYLQLTANKPGFLPQHSSDERWRDFSQVVNGDAQMLAARLDRFLATLP